MKKKATSSKTSAGVTWGPIAAIFGSLAMFLIPQIIAALLLVGVGVIDADGTDDLSSKEIFIFYGLTELLVLFLLLAFLKLTNSSIKSLGITKKNIEKVWYVVPIFIGYMVATSAVLTLLGQALGDQVINQEQELGFETGGGGSEIVMAFIALVIIAPIAEELLFRGFLFQGLKKKFDYRIAIVVSAILFGIAHGQLNVGFDTAVLGVALAWLMHETNNIAIPIALHMLKNFLAFLFIFVWPDALSETASFITSVIQFIQ